MTGARRSSLTADSRTRDADAATVEAMLGRPLRADSEVVVRCHLGLPAVIRVPPVLDDGTPFPTLYWLTCPLAVRRISKLESSGLMTSMAARLDVTEADADYAREREVELARFPTAGHRPRGGVGGAHGGIKCLHARHAFWWAGGGDPAGADAARRIGELDCTEPCVTIGAVTPEVVIRRPTRGIGPVDTGAAGGSEA
ncbi:MAG: DUF501 domain-containing protein [Acidimicrobiia bacterium]|nr:DUF501 domain-containing protein [Acidimicrobiia bacterium]